MSANFIKVQFSNRDCGPSDSWLYLNINQVLCFHWSHEDYDHTWHVKLVVEYASDAESDIFWIRPREFDELLKALLGRNEGYIDGAPLFK
jgi:hypothetical protein